MSQRTPARARIRLPSRVVVRARAECRCGTVIMEPEPQQAEAHETEAQAARLMRLASLEASRVHEQPDADLLCAEAASAMDEVWPADATAACIALRSSATLSDLDGKDGDELYNCGIDYQDAEDHKHAIQCFTAALEYEKDRDTMIARGNSLLETGQWSAAIADYTAALRGAPLDVFQDITQRLVELGALVSEGIFRLAGSNDAVNGMMAQLRDGLPPREILASCHEVNDVATFLGRWLREQPTLIPTTSFVKCEELVATNADPGTCEAFIASLPEPGQGCACPPFFLNCP